MCRNSALNPLSPKQLRSQGGENAEINLLKSSLSICRLTTMAQSCIISLNFSESHITGEMFYCFVIACLKKEICFVFFRLN